MKTVLITGAANGLGKALALHFLEKGWRVIATDLDQQALKQISASENLHPFPMNVSDDESVDAGFAWLKSLDIQLDLIINNAGIDRYFPFSEASVNRFKEIFEVNVFGGYRINQTFIPLLKAPGGTIIHIGSESLNLTIPYMPYPITKNTVERYAKALRQEVKPLGINVIVIRPGAIRTRLLGQLDSIHPQANNEIVLRRFKKLAESAPKNVGKVTTPEHVASFIFNVAQTKKPKAVYRINNNPLLRLANLFPFAITEKFVNKMLQ